MLDGTSMPALSLAPLRLEPLFNSNSFRRHVILPRDIAKCVPKGRLLTESEWRGLGVQQSRGWVHYAIHRWHPDPRLVLFGFAVGSNCFLAFDNTLPTTHNPGVRGGVLGHIMRLRQS